jgi:hypothetical protein
MPKMKADSDYKKKKSWGGGGGGVGEPITKQKVKKQFKSGIIQQAMLLPSSPLVAPHPNTQLLFTTYCCLYMPLVYFIGGFLFILSFTSS